MAAVEEEYYQRRAVQDAAEKVLQQSENFIEARERKVEAIKERIKKLKVRNYRD